MGTLPEMLLTSMDDVLISVEFNFVQPKPASPSPTPTDSMMYQEEGVNELVEPQSEYSTTTPASPHITTQFGNKKNYMDEYISPKILTGGEMVIQTDPTIS